jgi:hypothetical protein
MPVVPMGCKLCGIAQDATWRIVRTTNDRMCVVLLHDACVDTWRQQRLEKGL